MSLTTRLTVDLYAKQVSSSGLSTPSAPAALKAVYALANGTGADQADVIWTARRTIAASANEDLDLAGSLGGALGATLTFAKLKVLMVKAAPGNTNSVVLSRPASNGVPLFSAASDAISIRPGGLFLWVAPGATAVAVTASTGDLINIANSSSGTSVQYEIVIVGTSA